MTTSPTAAPVPVVPAERAHHLYSPSWLQNGEACPDYRSRDSKHVRTIAGTIAHKATETGEDSNELSDDDAIAVAQCLDFYESCVKSLELDARRAYEEAVEKAKKEGTMMPLEHNYAVLEGTETYLPIDDIPYEDCGGTTAGYVDRWIMAWHRKYAEVIDWKFGKWQVEEAANNLQGIAYMMGLFKKFPSLEQVRVRFKQPLIDFETDHLFTRHDLPALYLRIQTIVARARKARKLNDFSMANPAVPVCNFCARIGDCPKVLAFACTVGKKYHPLGLPADINPSVAMDPKNTKTALDLAAVLKIWSEGFRRMVTERVLRGDAPMPEGYQSRTMRKRELVDLGKYKLLALEYLTPQEWEACLDTTFSAVEKQISKKAPRGHKETTVEKFQAASLTTGATQLGQPISFLQVASEKQTTKTKKD
jgi:hypothetical protein